MDTVFVLRPPGRAEALLGVFRSAEAARVFAVRQGLDGARVDEVPWFDDFGVSGPPTSLRPAGP